MEVKQYLDALGPGPCSLIFFLLSDMSVPDFQYCFIVSVTLKVSSVLGLCLFVCLFLSSEVMKTTVYLISQYRDLIGISTLTHLKKKSWSPVRYTPVFHALFPHGTFHTEAYFRNTFITLYLIHHHLLLIFFCFLSVAILIISCSYVLWTLNLWTVSHYW